MTFGPLPHGAGFEFQPGARALADRFVVSKERKPFVLVPVKRRRAFTTCRPRRRDTNQDFSMTYTIFFLVGIPCWLIPVAYILRHETAPLSQKNLWATMTFAAPFLIFGLGVVGNVIVHQQFGVESPRVRAFGYFIALLNTLAFFSPFLLKAFFRSRYAVHQRKGADQPVIG